MDVEKFRNVIMALKGVLFTKRGSNRRRFLLNESTLIGNGLVDEGKLDWTMMDH
jgi:hypothetical protein